MTCGIETRELVCETPLTVFHVGDLVRKLRTAEGRDWTVEELAEKAGLNKATVSKLERGELDPRKSTIDKIAAALGVSASYLVSGALTSPDHPLSTTDGTEKAGADVVAQLHKTKKQLQRMEVFLSGALEELRQTLADLDDVADDAAPRRRA
jgi:transcriptional regulator with XRE-family HTH domain